MVRSWPQVLGTLADGGDLAADDTAWVINEIFTDNATQAQIAAFGVAMKIKGPTPAELSGMASGMLAHAPGPGGRRCRRHRRHRR